jgi:hypothetical protein
LRKLHVYGHHIGLHGPDSASGLANVWQYKVVHGPWPPTQPTRQSSLLFTSKKQRYSSNYLHNLPGKEAANLSSFKQSLHNKQASKASKSQTGPGCPVLVVIIPVTTRVGMNRAAVQDLQNTDPPPIKRYAFAHTQKIHQIIFFRHSIMLSCIRQQ